MAQLLSIFGHLKQYKLTPLAYTFCLSRFIFFKIFNKAFSSCPKAFKILQKWRNFAKSGYTACLPTYLGTVGTSCRYGFAVSRNRTHDKNKQFKLTLRAAFIHFLFRQFNFHKFFTYYQVASPEYYLPRVHGVSVFLF